MIFHYFNIIELYRKVCDQFGNILSLKYVFIKVLAWIQAKYKTNFCQHEMILKNIKQFEPLPHI